MSFLPSVTAVPKIAGQIGRFRRMGDSGAEFVPTDLSNLALWMRADTGVATAGARQYTSANSEYHSIADNADFSTGDVDFTIAGWVFFDALGSANGVVTKDAGGSNREYGVYKNTSNKLSFFVSDDGSTFTEEVADNAGAVTASSWYFFVAWHDASANTINIQVDNGTADSQSYSSGVFDGTAPFEIGRTNASAYMNGRISKVGFWKRTLTSDEKTYLYNSGNGRTSGSLGVAATDGSDLDDYVAYYNLNEASGNAIDSSSNSYDLTDNNTVTAAAGPTETTAIDSSSSDNDGSVSNADATFWSSDVPNITSLLSGYSGLFDGSDDQVKINGTGLDNVDTLTYSVWIKRSANGRKTILKKGGGGFAERLFELNASNKLRLIINTDATDAEAVSTETITDTNWHHLAATYDNAGDRIPRLYIDGSEVSYDTKTTGTGTILNDSDEQMLIGDRDDTSSTEFAGNIDDFRVYNAVLTSDNISYLATESSGTDAGTSNLICHLKFDDGPQSTTINDGDPVVSWESKEGNRYLFNQPTTSKRPIYTASAINSQPGIDFDGTDDLLFISSNLLSGAEGTVFIVFQTDNAATANQVLFCAGDSAGSDNVFSLYGRHTASANIAVSHTVSASNDQVRGSTTLSSSTTYIAMYQSNGTAYIFKVNGADETETATAGTNSGDWFGDTASIDFTTIGAIKIDSEVQFTNGQIAEVLVYDVELTAGEISVVEGYLNTRYSAF